MGCDHQSYSYDACSSAFSIVRSGYYSSIISFSSNGSSTISFYLTFSIAIDHFQYIKISIFSIRTLYADHVVNISCGKVSMCVLKLCSHCSDFVAGLIAGCPYASR